MTLLAVLPLRYDDVYITKVGAPYASGLSVASLYGAVRNDSAYGVNLKWKSPVSGITDSTAKPGGVLYNLQRGGNEPLH